MTEPFDGQSIPALQLTEDQIRAIVRDEIKKAIAEKVGDLTKTVLSLATKAAMAKVSASAAASKTAKTRPTPSED